MSQEQINETALVEGAVRKILLRLVPFLALLYTFNILDRTNIGLAASSMQKDLGLSDSVYGTGAGLFFVGYFLLEIPSNLMMERFGAKKWIARIMISWGLVSAATMFVTSGLGLYGLRFLLGIAEAGFYPGVVLYLTYWFPASYRARAVSRFLGLTSILQLIGVPLGSILLSLEGKGALHGWQWLFLLEGLPSVLLGFYVWKVLPNRPAEAKWLTKEESDVLSKQLAEESSNTERVHHMSFKTAFTDQRVVLLVLIFLLQSTGMNMVGFFSAKYLKLLTNGEWTDKFIPLALGIPTLAGALAMMWAARHSDRTGDRRMHVVLGYGVAAVLFIGLLFANTPWAVIFFLTINTMGERTAAGSYWAVTTNLLGARAAAAGVAFINSIGNLGGFFGPKIMGELLDHNRPAGLKVIPSDYYPGFKIAVVLIGISAAISLLLKRRSDGEGTSLVEAQHS